jgi:hypothetical protein
MADIGFFRLSKHIGYVIDGNFTANLLLPCRKILWAGTHGGDI